jgi:hypothetical protein
MSNIFFLDQYSHVEGHYQPLLRLISFQGNIFMILTYTFEDFAKFTLDFLTYFARKGINMVFVG